MRKLGNGNEDLNCAFAEELNDYLVENMSPLYPLFAGCADLLIGYV